MGYNLGPIHMEPREGYPRRHVNPCWGAKKIAWVYKQNSQEG